MDRRGGAWARQVEYAKVKCGSWKWSGGGRQLCGEAVRAVQTQGGAAGSSWEGDMVGGRSSQGRSSYHRLGASWMQSGELKRGVAGGGDWLTIARLRREGREGWSVEEHIWVCSEGPAMTWHGLRGAVAGWYLPVLVVDEI